MDGNYRSVRIVYSPDKVTARQYRELENVLNTCEDGPKDTEYADIDKNRAYIQRSDVSPGCQKAIQDAFSRYIDRHKGQRFHISLEYEDREGC